MLGMWGLYQSKSISIRIYFLPIFEHHDVFVWVNTTNASTVCCFQTFALQLSWQGFAIKWSALKWYFDNIFTLIHIHFILILWINIIIFNKLILKVYFVLCTLIYVTFCSCHVMANPFRLIFFPFIILNSLKIRHALIKAY